MKVYFGPSSHLGSIEKYRNVLYGLGLDGREDMEPSQTPGFTLENRNDSSNNAS